MVQYLTDMHETYWERKYTTPQTFLKVVCLRSYIALQLLQQLQEVVYFLSSLFHQLFFPCGQIILLFQEFVILAYIQFLF